MSGREVDWDDEELGALAEPEKKRGRKADVDLDLDELGLEDDEELLGVGSGANRTKTVIKKKPTRAAKKKAKKKKPAEDDDLGLADDEDPADEGAQGGPSDTVESAAEKLGIDLSMECPVCRSLDPCECEEEDRSFVRRTRFEEDVKKVGRCPRCQAPLSVVYLARPGLTGPPFRLAQFEAIHACSCCRTEALATLVLSMKR